MGSWAPCQSVRGCVAAIRAGWPGHGATPTAESTAKRRPIVTRRRPGSRAAPRGAGRCRRRDGRGRPRRAAGRRRCTGPGSPGGRAARSARPAEIASRTGVSRSSSWWSVSRERVGLVVDRQRACRSARSSDGRYSSSSLDLERDVDRRAGSDCTPARGPCVSSASARIAAVRPGEADRARRSARRARSSRQVDRDAGDVVVAVGAGSLGEQPGDVPGERLVWPGSSRVTGADGSSASSSRRSSRPRRAASTLGRRASASARRSSSSAMPFLMLWSVLTTSPSSPTRTLDRVLVGAAPDLVGVARARRR